MISKELSKEELLFSKLEYHLDDSDPDIVVVVVVVVVVRTTTTTTRSLQPSARGGATHQGGHRVEEVAKED
jgi:hypothetical protein